MSAVVDDAIHVEVEAVEFGDSVFSNELGDCGIALREPSEEFGDTHGDGVEQNEACVYVCVIDCSVAGRALRSNAQKGTIQGVQSGTAQE